MTVLGIEYEPSDWPHGLRCAECNQPIRDGDHYSKRLDSMNEDTPVTVIVCVVCALGGAA